MLYGFGFPGLADNVTVPPVANPNPSDRTGRRTLQSLSNPAARPNGLGRAIPVRSVCSFGFPIPFPKLNADHAIGVVSTVSVNLCAPSGGRRKINGRNIEL